MSTDKLPPMPFSPYLYSECISETERITQTMFTEIQMREYGRASRADLVRLVTAVHTAKGRYHNQLAMSALYDACGLPNEKPTKDAK